VTTFFQCLVEASVFAEGVAESKDAAKVDRLLYAGNSLGRARAVFECAIEHRPRIKLTIRQVVLR
jgi:hypothetical protein